MYSEMVQAQHQTPEDSVPIYQTGTVSDSLLALPKPEVFWKTVHKLLSFTKTK